jgi:hypothetical protein
VSFFLGSVSFGLDRGIFYSDFCSAFTKAHGFCHVTRSQLETCTFHGICRLQLIRSATHFGPDFAVNSFSNRPFLQFIRSAGDGRVFSSWIAMDVLFSARDFDSLVRDAQSGHFKNTSPRPLP